MCKQVLARCEDGNNHVAGYFIHSANNELYIFIAMLDDNV